MTDQPMTPYAKLRAHQQAQRAQRATQNGSGPPASNVHPITRPAGLDSERHARWAATALAAEAAEVAGTPDGSRNERLNAAAYSMGRIIAGGGIDAGTVTAALTTAGRTAGLTPAETAATIRSGLRGGAGAGPRYPDPDGGPDAPDVTVVDASEFGGDDATEATMDAAAAFARAVEEAAWKLRVNTAARAKVAAEDAPAGPIDAGLLAEILARPPEPPYRVEGLIPSEAGTLFVAQRKAGKTTMELNLARSLIRGDPFLGTFDTQPIDGRVAVLNYEVSGAQFGRWAADVGVDVERLFIANLRGRRNPLIAGSEDREALAAMLRGMEVESLIVDPFGAAYTGTSQNDNGEVYAWLADLDTFAREEVGARDLVLAVHAGWNGERTRGASALEDWADTILTLTRGEDADEDSRYLRAMGRDVDLDEDRVDFDPDTRRLTLAGTGGRRASKGEQKITALVAAVIEIVRAEPGINTSGIHARLLDQGTVGRARNGVIDACARAVDTYQLRVEDGPRGARCYYPMTVD